MSNTPDRIPQTAQEWIDATSQLCGMMVKLSNEAMMEAGHPAMSPDQLNSHGATAFSAIIKLLEALAITPGISPELQKQFVDAATLVYSKGEALAEMQKTKPS